MSSLSESEESRKWPLSILRFHPDHCYVLNYDGRILQASESVFSFSGAGERANLIGKIFHPLISSESLLAKEKMLDQVRGGNASEDIELKLFSLSGDPRTFLFSAMPVNRGGSASLILAVGKDISSHKQRESQLALAANQDALTGLFNRRYLGAAITQERLRGERYGHPFALAMLDIDDFKSINDALGHAAGDEVLRAIGRAIHSAVREIDIICRYGGDEFIVLFPETDGEVSEVAKRIKELIDGATEIARMAGRPISVSVGHAQWTLESPLTDDEILQQADTAMYECKKSGRPLT